MNAAFTPRFSPAVVMRRLGSAIALVAATSDLTGCGTSRDSTDKQFQRQVERAKECRQMQSNLIGNQALTPERADEIAKAMNQAGCTAHFPNE
jgi:hypothetical protein